jgi:hypothetical protein
LGFQGKGIYRSTKSCPIFREKANSDKKVTTGKTNLKKAESLVEYAIG